MPAHSRNSILVVPGSCHVFHPRKPTGTSHRNPVPVPIPNERGTLSEPVARTARYPFPELQDLGQDARSRYIWLSNYEKTRIKGIIDTQLYINELC